MRCVGLVREVRCGHRRGLVHAVDRCLGVVQHVASPSLPKVCPSLSKYHVQARCSLVGPVSFHPDDGKCGCNCTTPQGNGRHTLKDLVKIHEAAQTGRSLGLLRIYG